MRYSTLRLILALSVEFNLLIHQIDVTSAYLNGELQEDIYMAQPEQFIDQKHPNKVCKLKKALYGLKQSGRNWNEKLDNILKAIGFSRCVYDTCAYTMNKNNKINIIAVYVDDMIIACSDEKMLRDIKQKIALEFDIIDKGPIDYFLGMEIERCGDRGDISISQKQFIENLLKKNNMMESRKCSTQLDPGTKFKKCEDCKYCKIVDTTTYQSLIGSLLYI